MTEGNNLLNVTHNENLRIIKESKRISLIRKVKHIGAAFLDSTECN